MGNETCKPFKNLTAKWILHLEVANKIWVIHIDATKSGTKGSFPMRAHVTFLDKIAWAVISTIPQWETRSLDIFEVTLTEAQEEELNMHF